MIIINKSTKSIIFFFLGILASVLWCVIVFSAIKNNLSAINLPFLIFFFFIYPIIVYIVVNLQGIIGIFAGNHLGNNYKITRNIGCYSKEALLKISEKELFEIIKLRLVEITRGSVKPYQGELSYLLKLMKDIKAAKRNKNPIISIFCKH